MARKNVLKVEKNKGWKFYTIISSVVAVIAVTLVGVLVYLYISSNTDTYHNLFTDKDQYGADLTDYKINYNEIDDILKDGDTGTNIFIFAYDESFWDKKAYDELDEDNPNLSTYIKANNAIKDFVKAIEENHNKYGASNSQSKNIDKYCEFFLINTSLTGNNSILTDEKYGGSSDSSLTVPTIIYLYGEDYEEKSKDEKYTLSGGRGNYSTFTQVLTEAREYVVEMNQ